MSQCHKNGCKNAENGRSKSSYKGSYNGTKTHPPHRFIGIGYAEIKKIYGELLCEPNTELSLLELC